MKFLVAVVLSAGLLAPAAALSQEMTAARKLGQEMTAARKLGRGIAGIVTSPLEIPGNVYQTGRHSGPLHGVTAGLAIGLVKTVARVGTGVWDVVSAPFAVPRGYEPILAPEFPVEYFRADDRTFYGWTYTPLDRTQRAVQGIPGSLTQRAEGALEVSFPADLLFEVDEARLTPEARGRLFPLAETLVSQPDTSIGVMGFTDDTGSTRHNAELSRRRAAAVRNYLVAHGVARERIEIQGFGASAPIADNDTAAGRQQNRRVELHVRAAGGVATR